MFTVFRHLLIKLTQARLFPHPLKKRVKKLGKKTLTGLITLVVVILPTLLLILFNNPNTVEAAWANEDWGYRYPITVTNSTGSTQTNLQKLLTIDTSTLVTAGKLQSDCDDLRFTAQNGTVLPYYIDSGCNTTTTKVWILIDSLPTNGSVIYMYYGNPGAVAGSNSKEFDNVVGLVGYWTMNDTSGSTATDSSVNANNGTATGTTIVSGQKGNARSFNGTSDYVSTNWTQSSVTKYTISAWVKVPTDQTSDATIVENRGTGQGKSLILGVTGTNPCGSGCFANTTGMPTIGLHSDGEFAGIRGTTAINDNNWHHIVGTWEAPSGTVVNTSQFTLYIDGIKLTSTVASGSSGTASPLTGLGGTRIGAYQAWNTYFKGQIDDVRIYNTARTADQISSDYTKTYTIQTSPLTVTTANGSEEKAPSPVAYWKFDDGTGTTAQDTTTNNNDGTLTNGPSWQTEDMCVSGKCLKFDGTDDYVSLPNNGIPLGSSGSLQIWFRTADTAGGLVERMDNSGVTSTGTRLVFNSGLVWFSVGTGAAFNQINTGSTTYNDNKWHHAVGTWDGSTIRLYIDGNFVTSGSIGSPGTPATGNARIASSHDQGYLNGFIDEPKIYNYARSADQIKADYNSRANSEGAALRMDSGSPPGMTLSNGLVGYWKMDESSWTNNCTATSVTDSSGNSNNGKACPNTTGPTGGASGKFGNAGSFDGSDDIVTLTSEVTPTTLSWWMKPTTINSKTFFMNSAQSVTVQGNTDGTLLIFNAGNRTTSVTISTGSWQHFTLVWKGNTTYDVYKNGVFQQSVTSPQISLGQFGRGSSAGLVGSLDEVRAYNRALSPAEVTQLYNFAPGPVAYYNFEENTGTTVNDRSGNGNTGTWNGSGSPKWKPGKYGASGNFDGSTDYVNAGTGSTISITGSITVATWVKFNGLGGDHTLVAKDKDSGGRAYTLDTWSGASNKFRFYINGGAGSNIITSTTIPTTGIWYYVVGVYDTSARTLDLYVNGVKDATQVTGADTSIPTATANLTLGNREYIGARDYLNGSLDDVKIYNYARTQDQIISDMQGSSGTAAFSLSSSGLTGGSNTKPAAPVGYWRFDEGYSTTANNVGNGGSALNGTLTNMASPATSTSGWTQAGKINKALNFDGSDDYVDLGTPTTLTNIGGTSAVSISTWIKVPSSSANQQIIIDAGSNEGVQIDIQNAQPSFYIVTGSAVRSRTSTTMATETWYHFVGTYDGVNVKAYLNGKLEKTTAQTGNITSITGNWNIGRYPAGGYLFNGSIDEVKVYNFALTAEQVKLDMNQGSAQVLGALGNLSTLSNQAAGQEYCIPGDASTCSAPVGRWDFDEATGTTANDSSGNANTGTLTNGPTWKPGKVNKSLNFDGSDDRVDTSGPTSNAANSAYTVNLWFKRMGGAGSTQYLFSDTNASHSDMNFWVLIDSSNKVCMHIHNAGDYTICGTTTISDNTWYHLSAVQNSPGSSRKLYINGVLENSDSQTSASFSYTHYHIGVSGILTGYFNGQIDQVRVFNYARTPAQVAWDYNKGAPVGHWRMDECQGTTANDASGNSNSGTITIGSSGTQTSVGTCTDGSSASAWYNGRTGKKNYSLNFDGSDDYIETAYSSTLNPDIFTVSAWVYPSGGVGNWRSVITSRDASNSRGYIIYAGTNNNWQFWTGNNTVGTWNELDSNRSISLNQWTHIIGTFDGTTMRVYINGVLANSMTPSTFAKNTVRALRIGAGVTESTPQFYFPGQIDDARVYNYALTATQIKNLFSEGAYRSGPTTGAP